MWDWLWQQAQTASPFVAAFCLAGMLVLFRLHIRDQATILSMMKSQSEAMIATAVAMEKLSGSIREARSRK